MSLLPVGFGASGDDYEITDSLRLRSSASGYLSRTFASAGNRRTWTWSGWVKRGLLGTDQLIFGSTPSGASGPSNYFFISWTTENKIDLSGYTHAWRRTNAVYRDPSAWYHIVLMLDTTQATASNRVKLYVNGEEVTSFQYSVDPSLNQELGVNQAAIHTIGSRQTFANNYYLDGYITEANFIDGQALTADDFGEYDANGTWKAKEYTGTYGTNGFYLPMKPTTQAELQNTVLFTGTGDTALEINNVGYEPDFIWFKSRSNVQNHYLVDSVRGGDSFVYSNATNAENTSKTWVSDFTPNGFIVTNQLLSVGYDYVGWTWDAGDNQPSTGHSSIHFSGNGAELKLGGFGFSPDLIWMKSRSNVGNHGIWDSVRGASNVLKPNTTDAESSISGVTSFDADGYTLGSSYNASGGNYIAWGWDAGDGDPVSNTTGDINSTVKASDATGFSIVTYSANGSTGTIGHGLSSAPELIIVKKRNAAERWTVYHQDTSNAYIYLNETFAAETANANLRFGNNSSVVAPTSSVFTVGNSNDVNGSGGTYVAYCFSEVSGVSKFGSYSGTGSAGNAITGLGFKPGFLMIKRTDTTGNWIMLDSTRDPFNSVDSSLVADLANAEVANNAAIAIDFNSDGFTIQGTGNGVNNSSGTYIYMAFKGSYSDYVSPLNDTGTIDSRVKANPSKGFSIVSWRGNGSAGTIGHGLNTAPSVIIWKNRSAVGSWIVGHSSLTSWSYYLALQTTAAQASNTNAFNGTAPTSSVWTIGGWNTNTHNFIAYCFSEVAGYSKFGSYTGTGTTTGNVTTVGFRPAFLMVKGTSITSEWVILDNTRDPNPDPAKNVLHPNRSNADSTAAAGLYVKFTDTGFQPVGNGTDTNSSGQTYIYMAFADTRDAVFNFDASGNKNNWLPNNINSNAESESTYDLMKDTPSLVDENAANFATLNPLQRANGTLSNGNLSFVSTTLRTSPFIGTISVDVTDTDGYWYEVIPTQGGVTNYYIGFAKDGYEPYNATASTDAGFLGFLSNGHTANEGVYVGTDSSAAWVNGDVVGIGVKNGGIYVSINGVPANSGNPLITGKTGSWKPWLSHIGSSTTTFNGSINFGQQPFAYTPPTGFKKYNTFNLPDSTIEDGSQYFAATTYAGNGSDPQSIGGLNFQPDMVWAKSRSTATSHVLTDAVRGATKTLYPDSNLAEATASLLTAFNSDGFDVSGGLNVASRTLVGWSWKANGSGVSNNVGSKPSTVSANTTAGFSIVSWASPVSAGNTIGHGLNVAPKILIFKSRSSASAWGVFAPSILGNKYLYLHATTSNTDANYTPTLSSTTMTVPTSTYYFGGPSNSGNNICYAFAEVPGYSAFGSYTGNGSTDGPFVYTGFRPAWVMIRRTDTDGNWQIQDTARTLFNWTCNALFADVAAAENTSELPSTYGRDYLSNGFKIRATHTSHNTNGGTYLYMAFAENPFKNANAR